MLSIILLAIVSLTQLSPDTLEVKRTTGLSYRLFVNQDKLCFQYKLGRYWSEPTKLDSGDISEYAITVTAGDYFHLAYCKNRRVCYRTTLEPVTKESIKHNQKPHWSTWVLISPYFTEPASNISIDVEGEYLYIIWQTPAEDNLKVTERWERKKLVQEQLYRWFAPVCLSKPKL
jgi:hypothetical protein